MGIRCDRREEMASMEGVDKMNIWGWIVGVVCFTLLIGGMIGSIYMIFWGVYDE